MTLAIKWQSAKNNNNKNFNWPAGSVFFPTMLPETNFKDFRGKTLKLAIKWQNAKKIIIKI